MKLKKRQIAFLLFLIIGTIYVAFNNEEARHERIRKFSEPIFGTVMNVTYTSAHDLHDTIMTCLRSVDASLSMFNPKSTISRINRGETDTLDSYLLDILPMAQSVSEATKGAFDITVAPLVNAWGFGFKHSIEIEPSVIDSLRQFIGYQKIQMVDGKIRILIFFQQFLGIGRLSHMTCPTDQNNQSTHPFALL